MAHSNYAVLLLDPLPRGRGPEMNVPLACLASVYSRGSGRMSSLWNHGIASHYGHLLHMSSDQASLRLGPMPIVILPRWG